MGSCPLGVVGLLGTRELNAKLAEAVVVEAEEGLVGARRVVQVGLGGSTTEDERSALGRDAPLGALLVPGETALAAVDELERAGLEGGRDRGEGGVSGVGERHVVAGRVAERRVDGAVEGPGHQQEGLGHLTRRAVRDTAVTRDIVVGNLAALPRCERGGRGGQRVGATYEQTNVLSGVLLEGVRGERETKGERGSVGAGGRPRLEDDASLGVLVGRGIGRLRRNLLQAWGSVRYAPPRITRGHLHSRATAPRRLRSFMFPVQPRLSGQFQGRDWV